MHKNEVCDVRENHEKCTQGRGVQSAECIDQRGATLVTVPVGAYPKASTISGISIWRAGGVPVLTLSDSQVFNARGVPFC